MEFGAQWIHVGYSLGLEYSVLNIIELNSHEFEERAYRMLTGWMQRELHPCYCMLISAMECEGLKRGVEVLKFKIKSSKVSNETVVS